MKLDREWQGIVDSQKFSTRIEHCLFASLHLFDLSFLKPPKRLLDALRARLNKEANQVAFFKQLRILNPRHLCDLSHSLSDYPALRLAEIPGVANEWASYFETIYQDIAGPQRLVEWWVSRPSSLFKDHVLFLITMVMGTGSVDRFFSFAKYTDTDQRHGLHDKGGRLAFMTHYNGNLEGRLD